MTNDNNYDNNNYDISRRNLLGAAGVVGAAGALGGAATTSLLWDEEVFGNTSDPNVLQAGELDLKVDWEEHYADMLGDESTVEGVRRLLAGDTLEDDEVPLPTPIEPMLAVKNTDTDGDGPTQIEEFMDATSIEAYPDEDDDGIQDDITQFDFCSTGADLPEDLRSDLRTSSSVGEPLIDLTDVKPGDFGELTLSFHICGNPAYVSLVGELVEAAENGVTEPEEESPNEDGEDGVFTDLAEARDKVELLEAIQTAWWYDENCNNILDGGSGGGTSREVDVVIVFDESGSMDFEVGKMQAAQDGAKALTDEVLSNAGTQVGLVSFENSAFLRQGLTTDASAVKDAIDDLTAGGGTDFSDGLQGGHEELTGDDEYIGFDASGNDRDGADKVMVFMSNGSLGGPHELAANAVKDIPAVIYGIAYGTGADTSTIRDIASDPDSEFFFEAPTQEEVETAFADIGGQITGPGETVFLQDTLGGALAALSGGGMTLDSDRSTEVPDCYEPLETQCVGMAWWLPRDIPGVNDNSVQTDSVKFNFGFNAIQCRHNVGNDGPIDDTISEADSEA